MKDKMTREERLSDVLVGIDEDILEEAIRIDSAQKLKMTRRRERVICHPLSRTIAVAASIALVAGVISAIPHLSRIDGGFASSTTESSTVAPRPNIDPPVVSIWNFDSVGEIEAFLVAVKDSESAYGEYCKQNGIVDPLPVETAEKIADAILTSEYHVRLKEGFTADRFTAFYADDGDGILRLSFTIGQTQYVFSHFYGVTSTEDHGKTPAVGEATLGEAAVTVFDAEEYLFADAVFGNTRIYAAVFGDDVDAELFSAFEIVPTAEAFAE